MKNILIVLLLLIAKIGYSQDLFDYENSKKFAEYLVKSGQIESAAKEYERLVFMQPTKDSLKLSLVGLYRQSGNYEAALRRSQQFFPDLTTMPLPHTYEYSKILLQKKDYKTANNFWNQSQTLKADDKIILSSMADIFQEKFKNANKKLAPLDTTNMPLVRDLKDIMGAASQEKYKSPFAAGAFSAIVPGAGRFYTKDWKDALFSIVFTGAMAYQSYKGFNKTGINSTRGWIYGGVAFGFYLGNIYGSVASAKKFNSKKKQKYINDVEVLFNSKY